MDSARRYLPLSRPNDTYALSYLVPYPKDSTTLHLNTRLYGFHTNTNVLFNPFVTISASRQRTGGQHLRYCYFYALATTFFERLWFFWRRLQWHSHATASAAHLLTTHLFDQDPSIERFRARIKDARYLASLF